MNNEKIEYYCYICGKTYTTVEDCRNDMCEDN